MTHEIVFGTITSPPIGFGKLLATELSWESPYHLGQENTSIVCHAESEPRGF